MRVISWKKVLWSIRYTHGKPPDSSKKKCLIACTASLHVSAGSHNFESSLSVEEGQQNSKNVKRIWKPVVRLHVAKSTIMEWTGELPRLFGRKWDYSVAKWTGIDKKWTSAVKYRKYGYLLQGNKLFVGWHKRVCAWVLLFSLLYGAIIHAWLVAFIRHRQ